MLFLFVIASLLPVVFSEWSISLEYSFDDFAHSYPLGVVELRKQFDGNYTGIFKAKADSSFASRLKENLSNQYRIKSVSSSKPSLPLYSSTKPHLILQSYLYHHVWVTVDPDTQIAHSITVFPDVVAAGGQLDAEKNLPDLQGANVQGSVKVLNKKSLPSPDTLSFVQKMERERKARQHGADADNRSFLAKYWMYIVPVVLFMLISNAVAPEGGQEGQ